MTAPASFAFGAAAANNTKAARPPTIPRDSRHAASTRVTRQSSHSMAWSGDRRSCRLHRLAAAAGAGQEDLFERGVARLDHLAAERQDRVVELLERSVVDDAPRAAAPSMASAVSRTGG